jgi:gelsolin
MTMDPHAAALQKARGGAVKSVRERSQKLAEITAEPELKEPKMISLVEGGPAAWQVDGTAEAADGSQPGSNVDLSGQGGIPEDIEGDQSTTASAEAAEALDKGFSLGMEDSNIAGMGGDEDTAARLAAAQTEDAWADCGQEEGLDMWRIEKFKVVKWPKDEYGTFYEGDSYILLKTTKEPETGKLARDVYFWLGLESTQDEQGTAAYKTVELDDLFGGEPVQHREVQMHESDTFNELFEQITYLKGGVGTGFKHVEETAYAARLLRVKKTGRQTNIIEVTCERDSLNQGDAFILDAGNKLYVWLGDACSPFEKANGKLAAETIERTRGGKCQATNDIDDEFWAALGGEGPIKTAAQARACLPVPAAKGEGVLYKLTDSTGDMSMEEIARGDLKAAQLTEDDVFIVDTGPKVIVFVGSAASDRERTGAMHSATKFLQMRSRPFTTPIECFTGLEQAMSNPGFKAIFD